MHQTAKPDRRNETYLGPFLVASRSYRRRLTGPVQTLAEGEDCRKRATKNAEGRKTKPVAYLEFNSFSAARVQQALAFSLTLLCLRRRVESLPTFLFGDTPDAKQTRIVLRCENRWASRIMTSSCVLATVLSTTNSGWTNARKTKVVDSRIAAARRRRCLAADPPSLSGLASEAWQTDHEGPNHDATDAPGLAWQDPDDLEFISVGDIPPKLRIAWTIPSLQGRKMFLISELAYYSPYSLGRDGGAMKARQAESKR